MTTPTCPMCAEPVAPGTARCPHCGHALVARPPKPAASRRLQYVVPALLLLAVAVALVIKLVQPRPARWWCTDRPLVAADGLGASPSGWCFRAQNICSIVAASWGERHPRDPRTCAARELVASRYFGEFPARGRARRDVSEEIFPDRAACERARATANVLYGARTAPDPCQVATPDREQQP